jgi:hypothetical protein|tara:strand:- start:1063 stop:1320 length:258 start_codon:yes stop_codon:yes gene_type:complete
VLLAKIPPTFAAALIIKSGLVSLINFEVSSKENKSVSFLEEGITSVTVSEFDKILTKLEPTSPLDPNINTLILLPFASFKYIKLI